MRVIGIDPGTVSIDLCGLDNGRVFLDESIPTADALRDPDTFLKRLEAAGPVDLIAGPSGYGLPLVAARDVTETDLRLAFLAASGEEGGIGGLRALARLLSRSSIPTVFTPGVVHLSSVPAHRKINRVDMGTADKVCAAVLAVHGEAARLDCRAGDVSFILLELGGAFTAAIAVERGRIVDGLGGTSGPMGVRAAGALDGEVAYLAGSISKALLFTGGAASVADLGDRQVEALVAARSPAASVAWEAYIEGAAKAVAALAVAARGMRSVLLSGRLAHIAPVQQALQERLAPVLADVSVRAVTGFARVAKHAAQGAALLADGLAGGGSAEIVETMEIRKAGGNVLDSLHVISPEAARRRLGVE